MEKTKICAKCTLPKPIGEFSKNKTKKDGLSYWCQPCQKEYKDQHYRNNKQLYFNKNKKKKQKDIKWWLDYKSTLKCCKCGFQHPAAIDFHHLEADKKEASLADAIAKKGWGKKRILNEISKCIILCANCHRILHSDGRNLIAGTVTRNVSK